MKISGFPTWDSFSLVFGCSHFIIIINIIVIITIIITRVWGTGGFSKSQYVVVKFI